MTKITNCTIFLDSINLFEYTIGPSATMALILYKIMGNDLVNLILKHESVNKTLQLDEKYDVCISEIFNIEALLVSIRARFIDKHSFIQAGCEAECFFLSTHMTHE